MNNEFFNLKDQLAFSQLAKYLEAEDIEARVLEASDIVANNAVLVTLPDGSAMNVMYVPLAEDHYEDIRLMQFYAMVIDSPEASKRGDLLALLNDINGISPLGTFAISAKNELGCRHIFPVPRFGAPPESLFLDLFFLFLHCFESFGPVIRRVANGETELAEALHEIRTA